MSDIDIDVDTAVEVFVNRSQLIDDTDGKTIEESIAYNEAGMDLNWNFITTAGVVSQTNVVPTTSGYHDWAHVGNGMYKIEIPASGGTINNDTEGHGWFTGICTGVLAWTSPVYCFRASGINDKLIDSAYDANRGLAGTALPAAAADAAGGLPISDAGGLDLDAILADTSELQGDWVNGGRLDLILDELTTQGDTNEGKIDTIDGLVDTLVARLTSARAGYLDELDSSTAGKMAYLMAKLAIAYLFQEKVTESNGNAEQFDINDNSLGTITNAYTSSGGITTRKKKII